MHSPELVNQENRSPNLFLYSLILPAVWFLLGTILDLIMPGKRLGIGGMFFVIYATMTPICWHFAKNFKRQFTKAEKIKLIIYLSVLTFIMESIGFWAVMDDEGGVPLESNTLLYVILFAFLADVLLMTAGVLVLSKRLIKSFLKRYEVKQVQED